MKTKDTEVLGKGGKGWEGRDGEERDAVDFAPPAKIPAGAHADKKTDRIADKL